VEQAAVLVAEREGGDLHLPEARRRLRDAILVTAEDGLTEGVPAPAVGGVGGRGAGEVVSEVEALDDLVSEGGDRKGAVGARPVPELVVVVPAPAVEFAPGRRAA